MVLSSDCRVVLYHMPIKIRGFTTKRPDGYLIVINSDLCRKKQLETLEHELWHIKLGHLDNRKDLPREEKEREVLCQLTT